MSNGDATPVRRRPPRLLLAALTLLVLGRIPATATVVVPVSMETLAAGSPLVVLGRVEEVSAVADRSGRIFTLVHIAVGQVLKGHLDASSLTLKEEGGAVGGMKEVVFGTPVYRAGEEVLLFLSSRSDGSLRTAHLALGKFRITFDGAGMPQVERTIPADMEFFGAAAPPADSYPLSDILALLQSAEANVATGAGAMFIQPQPPEATDPSLPREFVAPYQLNGDRFFEPDEGMGLGFLIDSTGDALLGLDEARQAVNAAFGAWTGLETATVTLTDAGLTNDRTDPPPCPGPHVVLFDDPGNSIPPPSECHGTLALGGYCSYQNYPWETKTFAGRTFYRALRARVVFAKAQSWDSCGVWTKINVAEIATHELGHAIGLGHSSDPDATMYDIAHFDGRGASLRTDDVNAVSALYPTAIPLTITTPDPLPPGLVGAPYDVTLTVAHASGPVSWTLVKGNDPGLSVTSDGHITGSPSVLGSLYVQVKATDGDGNSHTKLLHLTVPGVAPTPTPTRSATRTATGTRTSTPTRTGSTTPTSNRTSTPTATATDVNTRTPTPSTTSTAPPTATSSPTAAASPTPSVAATATATASANPTASSSATATVSSTPTPTESTTMTATATATVTVADTPAVTATATTTPASTPSSTVADVASPTPIAPPTPSATASPPASPPTPDPCAGGCTAADPVTAPDLVALTAVVLADGSVERCPSGDADRDTRITVADTVRAVDLALDPCPQ